MDFSMLSHPVAKQRIMPLSYTRLLRRGTLEDEERFRARMAERLGADTQIVPLGRARSGIFLLVKFAVRGDRRKVLMSPFTIPDVISMVILAGGEPVFFDFKADSTSCDVNGLDSLIDDRTACVLITHYHVNEPELATIASICRTNGAYLFDDCAIAFGGSIAGRPIGTLTDASVFSFSSFKLLNFFWGGMITTQDSAVAQNIEKAVAEWPRLRSLDYLAPARACLKYDLASRPPVFELLTFPIIRKRLDKSVDAVGLEHNRVESASVDPTLRSRPSLAAFAEWWPKLESIDALLAHRRMIARLYHQHFGARMVSGATPATMLEDSCFVNFPIILPQQRRDEIARALMLSGFDVGRSLYPNAHRHSKFSKCEGRSDNVDRLVASTIYLPTHFGVSTDYAASLIRRLAEDVM
jgi:dTDP-4-amino-4,6-dideoxygalactose transaminase